MREVNSLEHLKTSIHAECHRGADKIAESIDRANRTFLEARNEKCASQMRRMMFDEMDFRQLRDWHRERFRQRNPDVAELAKVMDSVSEQVAPWPLPDHKARLLKNVRSRIPADSDGVNISAFDSAHFQTAADRNSRETGKMLHAAEALFFQSRDELPVAEKYGGSVGVIRVDAQDVHDPRTDEVRAAGFRLL